MYLCIASNLAKNVIKVVKRLRRETWRFFLSEKLNISCSIWAKKTQKHEKNAKKMKKNEKKIAYIKNLL